MSSETFDQQQDMKPTLGWYSATAIVAGSMIGSGIFIVTPDIARNVGTAGLVMLVWIVSGLITILGATSYGKLAAHMPKAGGQYVFLKEAWGELPAFLYGWVLLSVIQTGFLAAVAVSFAKYFGIFVPRINDHLFVTLPFAPSFGLSTQRLLAVVVLFGLTVFNCTGIKNGALLQNVFTSLKVLSLVLLILVGLVYGSGHLWDHSQNWSLSLPANHPLGQNLIPLFAFASVGSLFSADAWNYVTFIGGEIKNPRVNLPKALTWGTIVVVVLYIIANLAYLNLLPLESIQHAENDRVATAAMEVVFPGKGVILMAAIILVSTFGCLNGMLLAGARVFYAMAKDNLLFKQFGELHPVHRSPNFSMWAQFVWACFLALSGTYGTLLGYIIFSALVFYIITMFGLIKLGKQNPQELQMTRPRDFIIPYAYIIGATFIAFFLLFGDFFAGGLPQGDALFSSKFFTSMAGLVLTAIGVPIYYWWKGRTATAAS